MKITVITGSPNANCTSMLLAAEFIKGAKAASHAVYRFDVNNEIVELCLGCGRCGHGKGSCVRPGSMEKLNQALSVSDAVVFVTPLNPSERFGMPEKFKRVVDRIYFNNFKFTGGAKKAVLMVTSEGDDDMEAQPLTDRFRVVVERLEWEAVYILIAESGDKQTDYLAQAYRVGKEI